MNENKKESSFSTLSIGLGITAIVVVLFTL